MSKHIFGIEINSVEESISLNIDSLCMMPTSTKASPIDDYYKHTDTLFQKVLHPEIKDDAILIRLILLGIVSATEFYFRSVLAGTVQVCPLCRANASNQTLSLGAVDYYKMEELGFALLQNMSLSGYKEVKKQTNKITGLNINNKLSVNSALLLFDNVCHLRHAAVHSRGELNAQNVANLGLDYNKQRCLNLDFIGLQKMLAVCHYVVRAYNRFLFGAILERWMDPRQNILKGEWAHDKKCFDPLFILFHSEVDSKGALTSHDAYLKIQPKIKRSI